MDSKGVITGIGFLGVGAILRTDNSQLIQGLTTAVSIWLAACLGIACGIGAWMIAASALVLVMLILIAGGPVESSILKRFRQDFDDRTLR